LAARPASRVELQIRNEQLIRELAAERDRADRANQAKSGFLAAMSHDLRTPLNGIIGHAELIERGIYGPVSPPKYAVYVDTIRASGRHLLTLIDEVLDLAKSRPASANWREKRSTWLDSPPKQSCSSKRKPRRAVSRFRSTSTRARR
jgi:signal transduction histidine kinase